jgi:hypothetical protein
MKTKMEIIQNYFEEKSKVLTKKINNNIKDILQNLNRTPNSWVLLYAV